MEILVDLELDSDPRERDRMAERDEIGGALGTLDGGDPGHAEDVALAGRAFEDARQGGRLHDDPADRDGDTGGLGLLADIDHVGLTAVVEMGEIVQEFRREKNQKQAAAIIAS
jgi:hypothetical protein